MSVYCAERLSLEWFPCEPLQVSEIDDNPLEVLGKTRAVVVSVDNHIAYIEFYITRLRVLEVVLGYDWAEQTSAFINWKDKTLFFKENLSRLTENEENEELKQHLCLAAITSECDENDDVAELDFSSSSTFSTGSRLSDRDFDRFQNMMKNFSDCFSYDISDLGECTLAKFSLQVNTSKPFISAPYRHAESMIEISKKK